MEFLPEVKYSKVSVSTDHYSQSENILVLKYFSPLSGKMQTTVPDSRFLMTSMAAIIAAPLLMPTNMPSSVMILLAIRMASQLSTMMESSMMEGSYNSGMMASSMFFRP